jgi:amino acid permease
MKKTMFTVLWVFDFFVVGYVLFIGLGAAIATFIPNRAEAEAWMRGQALLISLVNLVSHGLPVLALVLGIFGLLPGTQNSENLSKQERVI